MNHKSFKYRLYPTKEQEELLAQFFGAKRWVFNHFLGQNIANYANGIKHLSNFDCNKLITTLKKNEETEWLADMDDWGLKNASADLASAYKNFFNSVKGKTKQKSKFPTFKNRHSYQSYRTYIAKTTNLDSGYVKLPKLGEVKFEYHQPLSGKIKTCTVSKTPSGKYFIAILCEVEVPALPKTNKSVGIDLGLTHLMTLSSGDKVEHPEQMLAKAKQHLKLAQKQLARKKFKSKAYKLQLLKVSEKYEKITNIRKFYYHNLSIWLVRNYDVICMEDLNIAGMLKNNHLARKISESAWATLKSMIKYKADWYGKEVVEIDRWFPSSKTCNVCQNKAELSLSDRVWTCGSCNTAHDRDINAAINILRQGLLDANSFTSDETTEVVSPSDLLSSLKKYITKIEKSGHVRLVDVGNKENSIHLGVG